MTAADIIRSTSITAVWAGLGGDPPERGRARAFYRDGDNPHAVSLSDAKGCWYDYRDNIGGGVLDLIQHILGCDRRTALRWLADFTGLPFESRPLTAPAVNSATEPKPLRLLEHVHHQVEQKPAEQKEKRNEPEPDEHKRSLVVTGSGRGDPHNAVNHSKEIREEMDHRRWRRDAITVVLTPDDIRSTEEKGLAAGTAFPVLKARRPRVK